MTQKTAPITLFNNMKMMKATKIKTMMVIGFMFL